MLTNKSVLFEKVRFICTIRKHTMQSKCRRNECTLSKK